MDDLELAERFSRDGATEAELRAAAALREGSARRIIESIKAKKSAREALAMALGGMAFTTSCAASLLVVALAHIATGSEITDGTAQAMTLALMAALSLDCAILSVRGIVGAVRRRRLERAIDDLGEEVGGILREVRAMSASFDAEGPADEASPEPCGGDGEQREQRNGAGDVKSVEHEHHPNHREL